MSTSSTNTETASKRPNLGEKAGDAPKDSALAALEDEVSELKDRLKEERFLYIVLIVILFDILLLKDAASDMLPILILVLELPILVVLAGRMGVQEIGRIFSKLLDGVSKRDV